MKKFYKLTQAIDCNLDDVVNDLCPSFSGIVSGLAKGVSYLDNLQKPKVAVIYSEPVGGFSILGNLNTDISYHDLESFLKDELLPHLKNNGWDYFEFSAEEHQTLQNMKSMFSNQKMETEIEYTFRMGNSVNKIMSLPDDYAIVRVDQNFLHKLQDHKIDNASMLSDILDNAWNSIEEFFEYSLAYVALYQNRIVSVIVGTSRFRQFIPIDIITDEQHRQKGLASALTNAFVEECKKRGLVAQWDCVESNVASQKTAKKCGFELIRQRSYYWFHL